MVPTMQMLVREEVLSMPEALKVTVIGLLVVFAVLFILILFIELLHAVVTAGEKAVKTEKVSESNKPVSTDDGKRISAGTYASVPDGKDAAQDGEFIAAVSAAVSVATGRPNGSFTIKSIKEQ